MPFWLRDMIVKAARPVARLFSTHLGPNRLALPLWYTDLIGWSFRNRWRF